jgi:flagellar M-ring protein FliF
MNQILRIWNSLSLIQRVSLLAVPLLIFAAAAAFLRWKHESDFHPLYSSLAPEDASALAQKMRESGIEYRLDETGSTILVSSGRIAEARLALAAAGMPRSGRIGFELFDRSNLAVSDFAEQVNYRRALEGELERTVAALSDVEQARVHLTFARDSVFLESKEPAKATVLLKLRRGGAIQQSSVTAIANLVAGAVDGLAPQSVAIVDSNGRLLNRPRATDSAEASIADANLDYRHQIEGDLTGRINAALEPLLGPGRFHAGVSVDCDFSSSEESSEVFEGTKSAVLQSQATEESTSSALPGGTPGTATNLPNPPRQTQASAGIVRRTENVSYQPSRTVRKTVSPKGTIRRISAAVLIDHTIKWEGSGAKARKVLSPPSPELLKGVREVIAGILGYDQSRGDQITVDALPFENTLSAEPAVSAPPAPKSPGFDFSQPVLVYGGAIVLLLVVIAALLLIVRKPGSRPVTTEDMAPGALGEAPDASRLPSSRDAAIARMEAQIAENEAAQAALEEQALSHIKMPASTKTTEVLIRHIRDAAQKDPGNAANVLRAWITDAEPKRRS